MQQCKYTIVKDGEVIKDDVLIEDLAEYFGKTVPCFRLHGKAGFEDKYQTETEFMGHTIIKKLCKAEEIGAENFPSALIREWDSFVPKLRRQLRY